MGIADFVAVLVALSGAVSPTRQAFGTPMLAGYHTHYVDRIRFYSSATALTELVADGFATTEPIFRAMEVALSQPTVPPQFAVGRRALAFTQVLHLTFNDTSSQITYTATFVGSDGVSHTYSLTSTGVPDTDAASFAALMTASNIGTVTVATNVVTTTQASGKLTDVQAWTPGAITIADATTDPGIATDLAAISTANSIGWYGVSLDSNSKAEILAAAAYVEATGQGGKFFFCNNSDSANDTAGGGDLNSDLQSESYFKTWLEQCNTAVLSYLGFGIASQVLALYPGSWAGSYKTVPGVVADNDQSLSETQRLVLNTMSTSSPGTGGKNGNWYATVSGVNVTWPGVTPGGRFADITIFIDWLQANTQADVFAVLAGLPKVPFDDQGIGLLGDAITTRMNIAAAPPYGGIIASSIVVNMPRAASIDATDVADRNLPLGNVARATLTGAIQTTEIGITLTP